MIVGAKLRVERPFQLETRNKRRITFHDLAMHFNATTCSNSCVPCETKILDFIENILATKQSISNVIPLYEIIGLLYHAHEMRKYG